MTDKADTDASEPATMAPSLGLGPLERAIMAAVWELGTASVAEVRAALGERHAYTTIMTVMARLAGKGHLLREKHGRLFRYRTSVSRAEQTGAWLAGALSNGAGALRGQVVQHFVDSLGRHDSALLDDLEAAVRRAREDRHS